jgi:hypothetical protein
VDVGGNVADESKYSDGTTCSSAEEGKARLIILKPSLKFVLGSAFYIVWVAFGFGPVLHIWIDSNLGNIAAGEFGRRNV